jgi:Bacterial TSP3 repeat
MIGWTGVPMDSRILADGYYDSDGYWIEDYSYDPGYTDPGYTDPTSSTPSYDPWLDASSGIDSDGDGLDDYSEVWGFAIPYLTVHSSSIYSETTNSETGETSFFEIPYEWVEKTSTWITTNPTDPDTDYDGLPDGYEREQGLNAANPNDGQADADGDGLSRGHEYQLGTSDSQLDTDGDGHDDFLEVLAGTDPLNPFSPEPPSSGLASSVTEGPADTTGSDFAVSGPALPNGEDTSSPPQEPNAQTIPPAPNSNPTAASSPQALWFRVYGFDPNDSAQLGADLDGDGLTLQQEYARKTNPRLADTDGDGLSDGLETLGQIVGTLDYGNASSYASSNPGIDPETGETLPVEMPLPPVFTSDPTMVDTDGDAYPDFWEWTYRTDPRNPFDLVVNNEWSLPTEFAYQQSWMGGYDDEDGDSLSNGAEFFHRTDPFSTDTDGDGLWDNEEINGAIAYGTTDPTGYYETTSYWDYDSSGEYVEITQSYWMEVTSSPISYQLPPTDPTKADTDGDGFDDGYEIIHSLNPNWAGDGLRDFDDDGVTTQQELLLGTSDAIPNGDLDGDGLPDAIELGSWSALLEALGLPGFDPLDPDDGAADYDGDGLSNTKEYILGTDFLVADTDGDGVNDEQEVVEGTDPLVSEASLSEPEISESDSESSEEMLPVNSTDQPQIPALHGQTTGVGGGPVATQGDNSGTANPSLVQTNSSGPSAQQAANAESNAGPGQAALNGSGTVFIELRTMGLQYGPEFNYTEEEYFGDVGGTYEEFDPATGEIITVGGGGSTSSGFVYLESLKYNEATISYGNGQPLREKGEGSAHRNKWSSMTPPAATEWKTFETFSSRGMRFSSNGQLVLDPKLFLKVRSRADDNEYTLYDGTVITEESGLSNGYEIRLVNRESNDPKSPPKVVEHTTRYNFVRVTEKFTDDPTNPVSQTLSPFSLTIPAGSSMSTEDGLAPVSDNIIKPMLTLGQTWSEYLLPVELKDIKDHADTSDDLTIANWNPAQAIADNNIAWIEPHTSATNAAPRMPQLELRIPGLPQNVTLLAKLLVEYERPYAGKQTDDTVKIPADGSFQNVTNGRWEIWNIYANLPFFGGDATLTYKIEGGAEQTIKFAIGGRNPDDSRCKEYTQGRAGAPWYAYAMVKHESQAYNPGRYNQFWERGGNSSAVNSGVTYTFTKGDALVIRSSSETGVGGAGLAQVTGAGGVKTVSAPREIFWNWQKNVDAFMSILLGDKIPTAEMFMNDSNQRSPTDPMPNGQRPQTTYHTRNNVPVPSRLQVSVTFGDNHGEKRPEDAVAIKAYNGAAAHWCSWRGPTVHEWQFNDGQNNYVEAVCNQLDP